MDFIFPPFDNSCSNLAGDILNLEENNGESSKESETVASNMPAADGCNGDSFDLTNQRALDMVEKINKSRTINQKLMDEFQQKLFLKFEQICQNLRGNMANVYEGNSTLMGAKLQELSVILENCAKESADLKEASKALLSVKDVVNFSQK